MDLSARLEQSCFKCPSGAPVLTCDNPHHVLERWRARHQCLSRLSTLTERDHGWRIPFRACQRTSLDCHIAAAT
jgi:hypothetical protein